jgi:hypothetical protein
LLQTNKIIRIRNFSLIFAVAGLILFSAVFFLWSCAATPSPNQTSSNILLLNKWNGDYPVSQLARLPVGQQQSAVGYINDMETFISLWRTFMPNEILPAVDFSKDLVVFTRNVKYYNQQSILTIRLEDSTAVIIVMETMSSSPIEDMVSMAMAVIPRDGVETIKSGTEIIKVNN